MYNNIFFRNAICVLAVSNLNSSTVYANSFVKDESCGIFLEEKPKKKVKRKVKESWYVRSEGFIRKNKVKIITGILLVTGIGIWYFKCSRRAQKYDKKMLSWAESNKSYIDEKRKFFEEKKNLRNENQKLETDFTEKIKELQVEKEKNQFENEQLKANHDQAVVQYQSRLQQKEIELEQSNQNLEKARAELQSLLGIQTLKETLEKQLIEIQGEKEVLERNFHEKCTKYNGKMQQYNELEKNVESLNVQLEVFKNENETLKKQLSELKELQHTISFSTVNNKKIISQHKEQKDNEYAKEIENPLQIPPEVFPIIKEKTKSEGTVGQKLTKEFDGVIKKVDKGTDDIGNFFKNFISLKKDKTEQV